MSLPFRCSREVVSRVCSTLLCALVIAVAVPNPARAWHGDDDWRPRHYHWHHHGAWGPRFFAPPSISLGVYPGYYPAPVYAAPYYAAPPAYVPVLPPLSLSFGFHWR